ncbi:MAG TPA: alpha-L-arabinofuranosidase C-terminal domain-containing protein, partial [Spirochaetota bacterium]|nr:alpha-L-arabinofuranosidase C-terminal domain-containing protein [Spirochaetota bacterium]
SFGNVEFISHYEMSGSDLHAKNSFAEPQKVLPREAKTMPVVDSAGKISVVFQPLSWNTVKFRVK